MADTHTEPTAGSGAAETRGALPSSLPHTLHRRVRLPGLDGQAGRAVLTLMGVLLAACGSSQPRTALDDLPVLPDDSVDYGALYRFLPLYNNTVYSYRTLNEQSGETGIFVIRVRHLPSGLVEFNAGGRQQWLELTENAVRQTSGGSLLRMPLEVGKTWKGPSGIVKLTAVGRRVDVPAGSYRNCIITTEANLVGDTEQRVITSYCPDVGIARLEVESTVSNTKRRDIAELDSFRPMVDWGKDGITVSK